MKTVYKLKTICPFFFFCSFFVCPHTGTWTDQCCRCTCTWTHWIFFNVQPCMKFVFPKSFESNCCIVKMCCFPGWGRVTPLKTNQQRCWTQNSLSSKFTQHSKSFRFAVCEIILGTLLSDFSFFCKETYVGYGFFDVVQFCRKRMNKVTVSDFNQIFVLTGRTGYRVTVVSMATFMRGRSMHTSFS